MLVRRAPAAGDRQRHIIPVTCSPAAAAVDISNPTAPGSSTASCTRPGPDHRAEQRLLSTRRAASSTLIDRLNGLDILEFRVAASPLQQTQCSAAEGDGMAAPSANRSVVGGAPIASGGSRDVLDEIAVTAVPDPPGGAVGLCRDRAVDRDAIWGTHRDRVSLPAHGRAQASSHQPALLSSDTAVCHRLSRRHIRRSDGQPEDGDETGLRPVVDSSGCRSARAADMRR